MSIHGGTGMDEQDIRIRELDLRERSLAFEQEKLAHDRSPKSRPGRFLRAFGAGAIAVMVPVSGMFLDVQQADRQAFEARLANQTDGYDFYFQLREFLKEKGDAADVEAVVRTMSTAFPDAFCGVRPDLHRIALGKGDSPEQTADLVGDILARQELSQETSGSGSFLTRWLPWRGDSKRLIECDPIVDNRAAAPIPPADPVIASAESRRGDQAGSAPRVVLAMPAPAPSPEQSASDAPDLPSAAARSVRLPERSQNIEAQAPALAAASRAYTVYVQISGDRGADLLAKERALLNERGFRLTAGVERTKFSFADAEVRYYRDDQTADAQVLADWMTKHFASEGLVFTTKPVLRKGLPDGILEIWVPEPANAPRQIVRRGLERAVQQALPAPQAPAPR